MSRDRRPLPPRDRGLSVQINYVLSLVIVSVMVSGLLIAGGDYLQEQRERTVRSEFRVLGNRLAADIGAAQQLAATTEGTTEDEVVVTTTIPDQVAGADYQVQINGTDHGPFTTVDLRFDATGVSVTEEVSLKSGIHVRNTTISGGTYAVEYVDTTGDDVPDVLEVTNA